MGCLSSLLPVTYEILASLEKFMLDSCRFGDKDLQHLRNCVKSKKLPSLRNLYLHDNRLCRMEDLLAELVQSCIDHYTVKEVKLWVQGNFLPQSFMNTWIRRCENTKVNLDLELLGSTEKNLPTKVNNVYNTNSLTGKLTIITCVPKKIIYIVDKTDF